MATLKYESEKTNPNIFVFGVDENYFETSGYEIEKGRNFSETDLRYGSHGVIIGKEIEKKLFPNGKNPIDQLKAIAKADIILQLTLTLNKTGPKKSITFNLQGLDSYTDKQVASASGTGAPSFSAEIPVLLEEAVLSHMDNFSSSLQTHFDDMFENGREVIVRIQKWDDWDEDLETEYGGEELGTIIEDWLADNTVKGRFSTTDMTENMALFEQVRIPLFNEKGRAIDARRFVKKLSKVLKKTHQIPNKLVMKGLGRATIILGGK